MSLEIEVGEVSEVLLSNGWHDVRLGSFEVDAVEYVSPGRIAAGALGGNGAKAGGPGFKFEETTREPPTVVAGPLTSILAVRCGPK
jgi:hypothetical protein